MLAANQYSILFSSTLQQVVCYCSDLTLSLSFRIVEGGPHWVQQAKPDIVNRHVRQFLQDSQ